MLNVERRTGATCGGQADRRCQKKVGKVERNRRGEETMKAGIWLALGCEARRNEEK